MHKPLALLLRSLTRGDNGFAESYLAGDWDSADLAELLELLVVNEPHLNRRYQSSTWKERLKHRANANSHRGSRRNIAHHYDLGNDFYTLWLDRTMSYSAAAFEHADEPLEDAQVRKYAQLLDRLEAREQDQVLEIGCGWGGMAEVAAQRGHRIDGVTLSREQLAFARERIARLGLSDLARFEYRDYRNIETRYDHVVSVEMFEAVGEAYWPVFFERMQRVLRRNGRAALQIITIDEACFESYRDNTDFIQQYIFPGGMLPSVTRLREHAIRAGFRVLDCSLHGDDYTRTLLRWSEAFEARGLDAVHGLGFDERFIRMWRYYLAYCIAGFRSKRVDLARVTLEKAD